MVNGHWYWKIDNNFSYCEVITTPSMRAGELIDADDRLSVSEVLWILGQSAIRQQGRYEVSMRQNLEVQVKHPAGRTCELSN